MSNPLPPVYVFWVERPVDSTPWPMVCLEIDTARKWPYRCTDIHVVGLKRKADTTSATLTGLKP